jgi:hypothetical protein
MYCWKRKKKNNIYNDQNNIYYRYLNIKLFNKSKYKNCNIEQKEFHFYKRQGYTNFQVFKIVNCFVNPYDEHQLNF